MDARRFQSFRSSSSVYHPLPLTFPLSSLKAREEGEGAKVTIDTLITIERAISREKPEVNVPLRSTPYTENKGDPLNPLLDSIWPTVRTELFHRCSLPSFFLTFSFVLSPPRIDAQSSFLRILFLVSGWIVKTRTP